MGHRVPEQDRESFQLDEPSARTHHPPGWSIQTIKIKPSGKAPKHYGPDTYRFGAPLTLSVILPRRGWTLVKRTKNYAYLSPPADSPKPPFPISIAIPSDEECLAIANRCFARAQSWMGQLGEWPAWYFHDRDNSLRKVSRDPSGGIILGERVDVPRTSSLSIGEWGVWQKIVSGSHGQFKIGYLAPDLALQPVPTSSVASNEAVWEGAPQEVELTVYERNPRARRLCIEHFGPTCQVCGFDYQRMYGAIGSGLIHVHHTTPLSTIREGYEVDPIRDLIPLCATCHHVVHSRVPPFTPDELRLAIKRADPHIPPQ